MANLLNIPEEMKQKIWACTPESLLDVLKITKLNMSAQESLKWKDLLEKKIGISLNPLLKGKQSWFDLYNAFEANWHQLDNVKTKVRVFEVSNAGGFWKGRWGGNSTGAMPSDSEYVMCSVNFTESDEYSLGVIALHDSKCFLLSPEDLRIVEWPFKSDILQAAYHSNLLIISYNSLENSTKCIAYFRILTETRKIMRVDGPQIERGRVIALSKEYICIGSHSSIHIFHRDNHELKTILRVHERSRIKSLSIRGERVTAFGYHRTEDISDLGPDDHSEYDQCDLEREISIWILDDHERLEDVASTHIVHDSDDSRGVIKLAQSIDSNQMIVEDFSWDLLFENGESIGYLDNLDDFRELACPGRRRFGNRQFRYDSQCRYIIIAEWPNYEADFLTSIPSLPTFHIYNGLTRSRIKTLDKFPEDTKVKYGKFEDFAIECRTVILFFEKAITTIRFTLSNKKCENSLLVLEDILREKSSYGEIATRCLIDNQQSEISYVLPTRTLYARLANWRKAFNIYN